MSACLLAAVVHMGLHRPALETWEKSSCLQRCGFPWQGEEGGRMQQEEGNGGENTQTSFVSLWFGVFLVFFVCFVWWFF